MVRSHGPSLPLGSLSPISSSTQVDACICRFTPCPLQSAAHAPDYPISNLPSWSVVDLLPSTFPCHGRFSILAALFCAPMAIRRRLPKPPYAQSRPSARLLPLRVASTCGCHPVSYPVHIHCDWLTDYHAGWLQGRWWLHSQSR